jgi:hypothetical protein
MKLSYEELEKEWHEAVERNIKYSSVLFDILANYECGDDVDGKIRKVIEEVR